MTAGELGFQIIELLLIAIPIASISWTITHEEVFRETRECVRRSRHSKRLIQRKFSYLFTCQYCSSHWVSLFFLLMTGFKLIYADWRGYLLGQS